MRAFCAIVLISCVVALAGCSAKPVMTTTTTSSPTNPVQSAVLQGRVHGGQSPVSGAVIQLWQVGSGGNGTAASALISGAALTTSGEALTDANGNFNITSQYSCPSSTTLVYLTATGGNPGLTGSINNSALVLMAALGQCGTLGSLTGPIVVNEVTTVASVYALAQFTGGGGSGSNISYYSPEPQTLTGLSNAFSEVLNIVNIYTGTARTTTGSGVGYVPQAEINTLADILVPCVNTSGPTSSNCVALFAAAKPSGGSAPTTVLGAALDIAQNPGNNVSTLYGLASANAAFQPALTAVPNDWTVALAYSVAGITFPYGYALDAQGNLWVSGWVSNNPLNAEVAVITTTGAAASTSPYTNAGSLLGPVGLAVDASGNVWVANCVGNTTLALKLQSNNISLASGPFALAGMSCPLLDAVDLGGNVWFTNNGNNNIIQLKTPFSATNIDTYTGGGLNKPISLTFYYPVLVGNTVWIANSGSNSLTEFIMKSGGTAGGAVSNNYTGGGLSDPGGIAVDSVGNMWAEGPSANQVAEINYSGTVVSPSGGWTGGGLDGTAGIAIDGASNVWISNKTNSSITEINHSGTAISPSTGYQSATLQGASGVVIDASGNVWVLNSSPTVPFNGLETVTEFLGVASPAGMPISESLPVV